MKRSIVVLFFVLLSLMLVSTACTPPAPEVVPVDGSADTAAEAEPITPQEPLVVLIDNDEGPITPVNFNTFIGFWMVGWVYDPLFVRSPDLVPIPNLATAAVPSEDGLTWEITLRDDVTWHDGEPFNVGRCHFQLPIPAGLRPRARPERDR